MERNMTPKDILGLIVRLSGLFLLACGIYSEFYAAMEINGFLPSSHYPARIHFYWGVFYVIAGLTMVRKAECIENFCYKQSKKPD
jgi:hypothetical protein